MNSSSSWFIGRSYGPECSTPIRSRVPSSSSAVTVTCRAVRGDFVAVQWQQVVCGGVTRRQCCCLNRSCDGPEHHLLVTVLRRPSKAELMPPIAVGQNQGGPGVTMELPRVIQRLDIGINRQAGGFGRPLSVFSRVECAPSLRPRGGRRLQGRR